MATLLLVGATGLVGSRALALALADPRIERVVAPTRRALPAQPRLENPVVDFDALDPSAPWWRVDAVVCALGTRMRVAGSQAAFRKVDHDYPVAVARLARAAGARSFALNSSYGADAGSRNFYLRTKGEVERSIGQCGYPSLTFVRPSFIAGERTDRRPLEQLALLAFGVLRPLVPRRLRAVDASEVAAALLEAAVAAVPGVHVAQPQSR